MKNIFEHNNWRLEQEGNSVIIMLKWGGDYLWTYLQTSWFGYKIGSPKVFEDEETANYYFEAAKKFLQEM